MKGMVSHLCQVAGVSRQGYHAYFSERRRQIRQEHESRDMALRDLVLKAFHFKKRKKGAGAFLDLREEPSTSQE